MLIGRKREQADLEEWCGSHKAELVCVYGRRRVGKTHLVENTFSNRLAFSVTGSEDKRAATQLKIFQRAHTVPMKDLAERFMCGFEFRTHAMAWQLSVMRDNFEAFNPPLEASYGFGEKWKFVMWSLERQERRLPLFRKMFFAKVAVEESADVEEDRQ